MPRYEVELQLNIKEDGKPFNNNTVQYPDMSRVAMVFFEGEVIDLFKRLNDMSKEKAAAEVAPAQPQTQPQFPHGATQ